MSNELSEYITKLGPKLIDYWMNCSFSGKLQPNYHFIPSNSLFDIVLSEDKLDLFTIDFYGKPLQESFDVFKVKSVAPSNKVVYRSSLNGHDEILIEIINHNMSMKYVWYKQEGNFYARHEKIIMSSSQ